MKKVYIITHENSWVKRGPNDRYLSKLTKNISEAIYFTNRRPAEKVKKDHFGYIVYTRNMEVEGIKDINKSNKKSLLPYSEYKASKGIA